MGGIRARRPGQSAESEHRGGRRLGVLLAPATRAAGMLRVLAARFDARRRPGAGGGMLRLGLSAGSGWTRGRLDGIRRSLREGLAASAEGLRAGLRAGAGATFFAAAAARPTRSDPLPVVPPDGGTWLAHAAADGIWRVRDTTGPGGDGSWQRLDRQGFGELRLLIAEAGGVMVTVQTREEGGRLVETRQRTRGHVLDGDRRDLPAIVRRCDRWVEYFYYAAGAPMGHERLSLVCLAGAGWPTGVATGSGGLARAA